MPEGAALAAASLARGAARAGVELCVYLPDSSLTAAVREFQRTGVRCVPCAREDEGVAIAAGLFLGGRIAVCLMEASGLGYSGLILARAQVQRTPVVVISSHSRGGGEPHDYHGATILVSEGIFTGLHIPYEIVPDAPSLEARVYRAFQTARSQLTSFGLLVPPFVMSGGAA